MAQQRRSMSFLHICSGILASADTLNEILVLLQATVVEGGVLLTKTA